MLQNFIGLWVICFPLIRLICSYRKLVLKALHGFNITNFIATQRILLYQRNWPETSVNEDETIYSVNLTDEVILEEIQGSFPLELFTATPNQERWKTYLRGPFHFSTSLQSLLIFSQKNREHIYKLRTEHLLILVNKNISHGDY